MPPTDHPLITVEISDCAAFVATLIIELNKQQIPAEVSVVRDGVDRTLTIIKLHGGY